MAKTWQGHTSVAPQVIPAENLAESCIWAARANRWLVQIVIPAYSPEYKAYEVASDAAQIIYERANAGKISRACEDRALWYLKDATGHINP